MPPSRPRFSLSARLLGLTVIFVMLAEVLIYTPSIARFRLVWLQEKLGDGHLAALAVVATREGMVTADLEAELLDSVGAYMVDMRRPGEERTYLLGGVMPPEPDTFIFLDDVHIFELISDAFGTLATGGGRVLKIEGASPRDPAVHVKMILDDAALHEDLLDFSWRILGLSILISLITASLVFVSLRWLTVRPLVRLTETMVGFREDPNDAANVIQPSRRSDEIGIAERELHHMQTTVHIAMQQKERLAALGTAINKINHDLRNMIAGATILSEGIAISEDPKVQQSIPRLIGALDRAADLCRRTLAYTREEGPLLQRTKTDLRELIDLVGEDLALGRVGDAVWENAAPEDLCLNIDAEELRRAIGNLGRNAFEAGATQVTVSASQEPDSVQLTIADNGPGLPPQAKQYLFQPFAGSSRPGGSGLGLAIAREIVEAHRGRISLVETSTDGTTFAISLPTTGTAGVGTKGS